jgi:Tat protein secretion system quality control protein TatD with DNase activity
MTPLHAEAMRHISMTMASAGNPRWWWRDQPSAYHCFTDSQEDAQECEFKGDFFGWKQARLQGMMVTH